VLLQLLEEVEASRDKLTEQLGELLEAHSRLQAEAGEMHRRTEGLLAQNLDSLVELGGQLTAAKVSAEVASCLCLVCCSLSGAATCWESCSALAGSSKVLLDSVQLLHTTSSCVRIPAGWANCCDC
jgi:hypothetical protein